MTVLGITSGLAVAGVLSAGPAAAIVTCPTSAICAYKGGNRSGNMFPFSGTKVTDSYWGDNSQGEGFIDDEASSFQNTANNPAGIWSNNGYGGPFVACVPAHQSVLGIPSNVNDEASSDWYGDCNGGH